MKTYFDCIPCFLRQALEAARALDLDEEKTDALLRRTLGLAQQLDWSIPPPVIGRDIHRAIREVSGDPDPYLQRKKADTEAALRLLPEVVRAIAQSADPFATAVKFSIAGNAIDLGAKTAVEADVEKTFHEALTRPLDEAAVHTLEKAISDAKDVLFLADNAGEIVFDRPLLEQIGAKVTVAVRGAPTINDATLDDAKRSGLTEKFNVISNGSDTPGTWLVDCSPEFVQKFDAADLVIAKGQGNYESLNDHPRKIFFLFLTKCPVVSSDLGIPTNTYVIRETSSSLKTDLQT